MRRAALLILLAGCAATPAPPATEPATSGGTLYVIDAGLDFFDDLSFSPDPAPGPILTQWVGEQALRILLRQADRRRDARLLGSAWVDLGSARPAEFRVTWPLDYLMPVKEGRFDLRRSEHTAWVAMETTPVLSNDEKYVTLRISLRRGAPYRSRLPGTDLDAGEPLGVFACDGVAGEHTVPVGGSLAVSLRGASDRLLIVLLHIASVRPT